MAIAARFTSSKVATSISLLPSNILRVYLETEPDDLNSGAAPSGCCTGEHHVDMSKNQVLTILADWDSGFKVRGSGVQVFMCSESRVKDSWVQS